MSTTRKDIKCLSEAYKSIYECGCQDSPAMTQPITPVSSVLAVEPSMQPTTNTVADQGDRTEQTRDMVLNNIVNINNKAAELVKNIQNALQAGEGIEEWVSEKIAVAAHLVGTISDYYMKYKDGLPINSINTTGLQLQPSTIAANFPVKPMADVIASF